MKADAGILDGMLRLDEKTQGCVSHGFLYAHTGQYETLHKPRKRRRTKLGLEQTCASGDCCNGPIPRSRGGLAALTVELAHAQLCDLHLLCCRSCKLSMWLIPIPASQCVC